MPYRRMELATAGDRDYWIASSEYTRRLYAYAGIAREKVFLSYYGTDTSVHRQGPSGRLRHELGLSVADPLVGMVAYIYAPKWYLGQRRGIKGHEDLINACALLHKDGVLLKCVFIGGPWGRSQRYAARLERLAKSRLEDAAVFMGTRSDVPELYGDMDIAVHPSLSENAGGAVESLLHAVPTVASSAGGLPEVVQHGVTGWLTPPASPADLARAIHQAIESPALAQQRARMGQALVSELFDVRRTATEIAGIYEHLRTGARIGSAPQGNARL